MGGEKLTVAAGRVPNVLDSCQISAVDIPPNSELFSKSESEKSGRHLSDMCMTRVIKHIYTLSKTMRFWANRPFLPSYVYKSKSCSYAARNLSDCRRVRSQSTNITNQWHMFSFKANVV